MTLMGRTCSRCGAAVKLGSGYCQHVPHASIARKDLPAGYLLASEWRQRWFPDVFPEMTRKAYSAAELRLAALERWIGDNGSVKATHANRSCETVNKVLFLNIRYNNINIPSAVVTQIEYSCRTASVQLRRHVIELTEVDRNFRYLLRPYRSSGAVYCENNSSSTHLERERERVEHVNGKKGSTYIRGFSRC